MSNAGYGKRIKDVSEIPLSEFEITLHINLRAPFLLVKGVVEGMKAQKWGRIIFVSSIAAYGGGMNVRAFERSGSQADPVHRDVITLHPRAA